MSKTEIYFKYKDDFTKQNRREDVLQDSSQFLALWRYVLPNNRFFLEIYIFYGILICVIKIRLRPWCCIPGKCSTCGDIDRLRRSTADRKVHKYLREAHLLHRGGYFQRLRLKYKERVNKKFESSESREKICSVIIDTMDQNHCHVPSLGSQDTFSDPIKQVITGNAYD